MPWQEKIGRNPNLYCKVKTFFPKLQCFLFFFEFRKEYYEKNICLSES